MYVGEQDVNAVEELPSAGSSSKRSQRGKVLQDFEDSCEVEDPKELPADKTALDTLPNDDKVNQKAAADVKRDLSTLFAFVRLTLAMIITNTNLYGAGKYGDKWRDVTEKAIWRFLAIVIYIGITWQPTIRSYWCKAGDDGELFGRPFVQKQMSRQRFETIFRCLHFTNVVGLSKEERAEESSDAAYWRMGDFLTIFAGNCLKYVIAQCKEE